MRTSHLLVLSFLVALASPGPAAALDAPLAPASAGPAVLGAAPLPAHELSVEIRCADCDSNVAPTVSLLWRADDVGGEHETLRALRPSDWNGGTFELTGGGLPAPLVVQGQPLRDGEPGWRVDVPLFGRPLPFRAVLGLPRFVAEQAVWWPARDANRVIRFELEPTRELLDRNPAWDPARTGECDVLVPKEGEGPRTFFLNGEPWGWLFPRNVSSPDDGTWAFQFVKPGRSTLERVSVGVTPSDEGAHWGFRLPLAAVMPRPAVKAGESELEALERSLVRVSLGEQPLGELLVGDCPRTVSPAE